MSAVCRPMSMIPEGLTNVQAVYYADQVNAQAQEAATVHAQLAAMSAPGPQVAPVSLHVTP